MFLSFVSSLVRSIRLEDLKPSSLQPSSRSQPLCDRASEPSYPPAVPAGAPAADKRHRQKMLRTMLRGPAEPCELSNLDGFWLWSSPAVPPCLLRVLADSGKARLEGVTE